MINKIKNYLNKIYYDVVLIMLYVNAVLVINIILNILAL